MRCKQTKTVVRRWIQEPSNWGDSGHKHVFTSRIFINPMPARLIISAFVEFKE